MKQFSKRFLTILLAAAMVFGLSGMTAFAAEAEETDSSAQDEVTTLAAGEYQAYDLDFGWYTDPGAKAYTITEPGELAALSAIVNGENLPAGISQNSFKDQTIYLGKDITMNAADDVQCKNGTWGEIATPTATISESACAFTPIGNERFNPDGSWASGYSFEGTFNGNGFKIVNLFVTGDDGYLGLFGVVGGEKGEDGLGLLEDFTVTGVIECEGGSDGSEMDFIGGVCAKLNAGATIDCVTNEATIIAPYTDNVGGIVGFAGTPSQMGGSDNPTTNPSYDGNPSGYNTFVSRCANKGTVLGYHKVGGIVGENAATVEYCYNAGWILCRRNMQQVRMGGIAGSNGNNGDPVEESVIAYCYNKGRISNNGCDDLSAAASSGVRAYAGIAGANYGGEGKNEVYNCYNMGAIPQGYADYNSIASRLDASDSYGYGAYVAVRNNYTLKSDDIIINEASNKPQETGFLVDEKDFLETGYGDDDILTCLGPYFVADDADENEKENGGFPILWWQKDKNAKTPALTGITIVQGPQKTQYKEGETFDPTDMIVIAEYGDTVRALLTPNCGSYEGHSYDLTDGYSYNTNPLTTDVKEITVTYQGRSDSWPITVGDGKLTDLTVTSPDKLIYSVGDTFDPTGMTITAVFNDGEYTTDLTTDQVTFDPGLDQALTMTDNEITVTFTLGDQSASATVTITVTNEPHTDDEGRYLIGNLDELEWFADQVNNQNHTAIDAIVTADIDATESDALPIGTIAAGGFSGTFDGDGHTITVDMNTYDRDSGTGAAYPAGVLGYVNGGSVTDLTVDGTVYGKGNAAGVAGYVIGGSVTNCVNQASVTTSASNVGGIVGHTATGTVVIDGCINEGDVSSKSGGYAGGIVGNAENGQCIISNCVNYGSITAMSDLGGVVGYETSGGSITNCGNNGSIVISATGIGCFYVAGIAGYSNSKISCCYNKGDVSGYIYVGGIVGSGASSVVNCYNTAAITSSYNGDYYSGDNVKYAAGGITGNAGNVDYTNIFNMGMVSALHAGALIGCISGNVSITDGYYLTGTADAPYQEGDGQLTVNRISQKSAEEIASEGFLDLINSDNAFKKGCTHPVLTWETDAGHVWGEVTWSWDDYSSATASRTCTVCDTTETVDAVITSETTAPTATKDGETVYTATATFEDGTVVTDTKTEILPATGEVNKDALWEEYEADSALIKQDYTSDSWAPLEKALEDAETVLNNVDATEEEVSEALSALQSAKAGLKEIAFADISVVKDGDEVAVISGAEFKAAQDAAKETTFTMLRGDGSSTEVTARFVLVSSLLGEHQPDTGCGVEMNAVIWADMESLYIYYREDTDSYSMAVDETTGGAGWYNGVTTITLGHVYKDGVCEICGASEPVTEPTVGDVEITSSVPGGTMTYDGSGISLSASAEVTPGTAQVTYQWYKDGTAIEDANDATLTLAGNVADSGTYKCEVTATNSAGTASGSGEITVTIEKAAQAISFAEEAFDKTVGDNPFTNTLNETKVDTDGGASITYKSSDETIATVDKNGQVTIVAAGEVTITAVVSETDNYNGAKASYTITIVAASTVDKTGLESEIAAVEEEMSGLSKDDYTEVSWNALAEALEKAQKVFADESATQDDVDGATLDLVTALAGLTKTDGQSADKSGLLDEYTADSKLNESDYTEATWKPFAEALANAQSVLNDTSAMQDKVNDALTALQTARENLAPVVDKEGLEDEVNAVEKELSGLNEDAYTEESWEALQKALANAQTVLADESATQDDVNAALNALKEADNSLEKKNGLYRITAGKEWGYYKDGKVDTSYTGFQTNENGTWYVENGYIHFDKNSVYKDTKGEVDGAKGTWYYVVGNKVQKDFTGLAHYKNQNGWWYIVKGAVDFTHNGVDKNQNGWWYVTGGKVQFGFTGLANYKNQNGWWYINRGKVNFNANTVAKNKNGWWYVVGGKVRFDFTGLANYKNANGWWYIAGGKVDFTHNGVDKNKNGWWYVRGGKVNFNFAGIASNANGTWYLRGGKVQFGYSGRVNYGGRTYTVQNGRVI